jgi:hypothetical protein
VDWAEVAFVKHVVKIETGIRVVSKGAVKPVKQPESGQSWDQIVEAIDERAHYIGPVLDHLLHLDQEVRPWILRE